MFSKKHEPEHKPKDAPKAATPPAPVGGLTFDGHAFNDQGRGAHWLYVAYYARRGDAAAAELLTGLGVTIKDAAGESYWPA